MPWLRRLGNAFVFVSWQSSCFYSNSMTLSWLAHQLTDVFVLYLAFSCPLYPLFLPMDNTWYFFFLIYTLFSDFSRSFHIPNDPVLQNACSCRPPRHCVQTGKEPCSKCLQSALFHCSSMPCIRHGFAGSVVCQRKKKKGEMNILKCLSISIWFLILSCMYFITLCFRGTWS